MRTVLFGLDKGQGTFKFIFIDTAQRKFNTGRNCRMILNVNKAPGYYENLQLTFRGEIANFITTSMTAAFFASELSHRSRPAGLFAKVMSIF